MSNDSTAAPMTNRDRFLLAAQKFCSRAGLAYAGWIGQKWLATEEAGSISGLVHTIQTWSDRAGGAALIAGLGAFGYSFGVKSRKTGTL